MPAWFRPTRLHAASVALTQAAGWKRVGRALKNPSGLSMSASTTSHQCTTNTKMMQALVHSDLSSDALHVLALQARQQVGAPL